MGKAWTQTWKNVLFQHFEIKNINDFKKYLPKNCIFDSFEEKYYLGLVSMQMTNVKHKMTKELVWFKSYDELNVRLYILKDNKPGVLFISLDVNSLISVLGARIFYGLPYRLRIFQNDTNNFTCFNKSKVTFDCEFKIDNEFKKYPKQSFAFWATERYFFVNKHLGLNLLGEISHKPWELCIAQVENRNLDIIKSYELGFTPKDSFFCKSINVTTSKLRFL